MAGTSFRDMITRQVVWQQFGTVLIKNLITSIFFSQECEAAGANKMIEHLRSIIANSKSGDTFGKQSTPKDELSAASDSFKSR